MSTKTILVEDVAKPGEQQAFIRAGRKRALWLVLVLLPTALLYVVEWAALFADWLHGHACTAARRLHGPANRWEKEQQALTREWHRRASVMREAGNTPSDARDASGYLPEDYS